MAEVGVEQHALELDTLRTALAAGDLAAVIATISSAEAAPAVIAAAAHTLRRMVHNRRSEIGHAGGVEAVHAGKAVGTGGVDGGLRVDRRPSCAVREFGLVEVGEGQRVGGLGALHAAGESGGVHALGRLRDEGPADGAVGGRGAAVAGEVAQARADGVPVMGTAGTGHAPIIGRRPSLLHSQTESFK